MPFTERSKTIALAIVKIFETSKPFGRYDAVAVLNDGAGISYGTSQFTHRSGSLAKVITRYLKLGGSVGADEMAEHLPQLKSGANISALSKNAELKKALKEAGNTPEMQQAQREIAFENYLKPALEACEGSDFDLPLSLAVIYDSLNHGSYAKIRDKVKLTLPPSIKPDEYEKEWITQYTQKRDKWLESVPRLAATDYRTDFFLAQIARNNWQLKLPMTVHGFRLTDEILFPKETFKDLSDEEIVLDIPTVSTTAPLRDEPTSGELVPPATIVSEPATPAVVDPIEQLEQQAAAMGVPNRESVVVENRKKQGLIEGMWKKITVATGADIGWGWVTEKVQAAQQLGISPEMWKKIGYAVSAALVVWVISEFYKHYMRNTEETAITGFLTHENSTEQNYVMLANTADLAEYRAKGYKVIPRPSLAYNKPWWKWWG